MTEDELLAQFPAVHASILTKGMEAERKRVNAHLKMAKTCGAMDVAEKAIVSGLSIRDEEVFADYQTAAINRRDQANRQADSDGAGAAVAAAKSGAGASPGAPGGAETPVAAVDGEDPELLVAAADIYCGPRKPSKGKA